MYEVPRSELIDEKVNRRLALTIAIRVLGFSISLIIIAMIFGAAVFYSEKPDVFHQNLNTIESYILVYLVGFFLLFLVSGVQLALALPSALHTLIASALFYFSFNAYFLFLMYQKQGLIEVSTDLYLVSLLIFAIIGVVLLWRRPIIS